MELLIGALMGVGFFVLLSAALYIGYSIGRKRTKLPDLEKDDDKQREIEQLNKDFKNLMSYDMTTALQRKKVTE